MAYKTYIAIGEHKKYIGTISEIAKKLNVNIKMIQNRFARNKPISFENVDYYIDILYEGF